MPMQGCSRTRDNLSPSARRPRPDPRSGGVCAVLGPSVLLLALLAGGCGRATVERRIDRVLGEGSARVAATPPGASYREDANLDRRRPGQASREPSTVNPPAEAMSYTPADPKRDVAAALSRYSALAGVPGKDQVDSPEAMQLTFRGALRQAQLTSREFITAEEEYVLAAIRLLIERHRWGPRFFNDTTVSLGGSGDDGDFSTALNVINTLRATQRLPYGGEVEASWVFRATEQLREQASGRYTNSSALALSARLPLLRGAGEIAREDLIQAERNLVYAARRFERTRRELLVEVAREYFDLLESIEQIANQERSLEALRELERSTAARVNAGRLDSFQTSIASNRVLSATAQLASLRERYILQIERFKIRLGLSVDQPLALDRELIDLPEPAVDLTQATALAIEYRLDLQTRRDQLDDARRDLAIARDRLLPDLDVRGTVSMPTDEDERQGNFEFDPEELEYELAATLSLPLDREIERLSLRESILNLQRQQRQLTQLQDEIVVAVRSALRAVDLARFQLTLAEQQVEVNRRRLLGQELKADTLTPQELVDSRDELLRAENERDRARTNLRNAVLNYLLESDQLRVTREGDFQSLPGMDASPTGG